MLAIIKDFYLLEFLISFMVDPNIDKKIKIIENRLSIVENVLSSIKNTNENRINAIENKINEISEEIANLKNQIATIDLKIRAIIDQLPLFAPMERLKAIEKYIDIIDPFSYLTKKEAERLIEKKFREMIKELNIMKDKDI
ncbi:MAG: hypothetical protein QXM04_00750 [Nanopusillaceae archaeon]